MQRCQEIFNRTFTPARLSGYKSRVDKDCKKACDDDGKTESAWLRRRSSSLDDAVMKVIDEGEANVTMMSEVRKRVMDAPLAEGVWTDRHARMEQDQRKKMQKRKLDAIMEGEATIDIMECDNAEEELSQAAKKRKQNQRQHVISAEKMIEENGPKNFELHPGNVVYVHDSCDNPEVRAKILSHDAALWQSTAANKGLPIAACTFIVENVLDPPLEVKWCAQVIGGTIIPVDTLLKGRGVALSYLSATTIRRSLWITPSFQTKHTKITEIMKRACALRGSKWNILADIDAFLKAFEKARAQHRPAEVCCLTRKQDELVVPGVNKRLIRVYDQSTFLEAFARVDPRKSQAGAAKR